MISVSEALSRLLITCRPISSHGISVGRRSGIVKSSVARVLRARQEVLFGFS